MLGEICGILWVPESASSSGQVPLILAGQPGGPAGLDLTYPALRGRAQSAARAGFATATIELPGSGARAEPAGVDQARAELRQAVTDGKRVADDLIDRLVLPLVDRAVPEWQSTLDALLAVPEIGDRVGYSGGVISVGTRLAAVEPRISAAVLFAGSYVPRTIMEEARHVTIPLYVLLQWDDEHNDRHVALDLFDAFGTREKTLNANLGGHTGVPQHAGEEATRFFTRHLRSVEGGPAVERARATPPRERR
ncbi:alpha/beta hydrolase [Intrasporangium sp.]|uniref:alpha/beta hydrolase n=1 Tax=Intrasporangium sp. TaxID=1925024 RepID=UPI00293C1344|nr:alpha/beta hydrolase [Intrasporangium sp.]